MHLVLLNTLFALLSLLSLLQVSFSSLCPPPTGSIVVYDQCQTVAANSTYSLLSAALNGPISYFDLSPSGILSALYYSAGQSIAFLLNEISSNTATTPVVIAGNVYSPIPIPVLENVTVVEALTADVKLAHDAVNAFTVDVGQMLALGLFLRADDALYPDVSNPFLSRLAELDDILTALNEIDLTLGTYLPLISTALTSLATVSVPVRVDATTGTITSSVPVALSTLLYDALYLTDAAFLVTPSNFQMASVPISRAVMSGYLPIEQMNPNYAIGTPGYCNINITGPITSPGYPLGGTNFQNPSKSYLASLAGALTSYNPITTLQTVSTQECHNTFGVSYASTIQSLASLNLAGTTSTNNVKVFT